MTPPNGDERRTNYPRSEKELYKLNIKKEIPSERRTDELDRMREVKQQKRTWKRTIILCAAVNTGLLILALIGALK
jgi:hypothetical protein